MKKLLLLTALTCGLWTMNYGLLYAQWSTNPAVNNAICTATGDQQNPQVISDGAGGAIITWWDVRSGIADIYAQRVNASGVVQWTANGVAICTATNEQYYPQLVSDGAGGAIITWHDRRSGSNWDIYAQNVCSFGSIGPCVIITWTGNTDTDWNNSGNWSNSSVPTASSDVVIPNVANDPVISTGITINNIDLASGATLRVVSGGTLTLNGALANAGAVTIQSGGSFLQGGSSSLTGAGTFSVQRQGSASLFNMWSSPITAQNGVPGTSYEYVSSGSTQDDSDDQPSDPGWSTYNGSMTPGKGFAGQGGGLATFTGTPNNSNVNYSLYYTAFDNTYTQTTPGTPFNLVGNPYPSAISAASFLSANTDIDGTIFFWNDNGSNNYSRTDYAYWNGTGALGTGGGPTPNGFIGTAQGFMVRALNGGAVANFTNAMRVAGNNTQFHKQSGDDHRMWFSVENADVYNEILIGLLSDATDGEDRLYDGVKIKGNPNVSLAAVDAGTEYAIMAFPPPLAEKSVPLMLEIAADDTYTFMANTMENFAGYAVYFEDVQNNTVVEVEEGQPINVNLLAGTYTNRFYLNFVPHSTTGINEAESTEIRAYVVNGQITIINSGESAQAAIEVLDMNGRTVLNTALRVETGSTNRTSVETLATGVYVLRVTTGREAFIHKFVKH